MAYGCLMECIPLPIEAVNTHRDKPKVVDGEHSTRNSRQENKIIFVLFLELST